MKYELILPYIEKGLITERAHPEDPDVRIFNYTQKCQFAREWDEVTMQCRGLIMNVKTGEVLARPFSKFFNYQEHIAQGKSMPNEKPVITDKMDGSLGILYHLNGYDRIATRGSFTSEQAEWATRWWHEHVGHKFVEPKNTGRTLLFEIIYPANRIVVNYDFSGLVFLAAIYNDTGHAAPASVPEATRQARIIRDDISMDELEKMDEPNSEGFVLFYPQANLRLKVKFPEYVRLHKILTGLSELGIWEALSQGKDVDITDVPDEFFKWLNEVKDRLWSAYNLIAADARNAVNRAQGLPTRKEQAQEIARSTKYQGVAFAMLDGKDYATAIWRLVRPHGATAFKKDMDA